MEKYPKSELLEFELTFNANEVFKLLSQKIFANTLNEKEWLGKEPKSCKVVGFEFGPTSENIIVAKITVEYKPKTLIGRQVYKTVDFNKYDFGKE